MNQWFYQRIAVSNIKKNRQTYFPYILTCAFSIMAFYIMDFMSVHDAIDNMFARDYLKYILRLGTYIIGLFTVIFLFYTNGFLIKKRK